MTRAGPILVIVLLAGCAASDAPAVDQHEITADGGAPDAPVAPVAPPDAPVVEQARAGTACSQPSDCGGGACLGAPGQPLEGNPRFSGGYCSTIGCTPDSQDGCGVDEWCIDGGDIGGICVAMCSKGDGLHCARADHVCLGINAFGGCFSRDAVECTVVDKMGTGCPEGELCIKIGFDDYSLGRCETACDPMLQDCSEGHGCYLVTAYNLAFCGTAGTAKLGQPCDCDKCCEPGLACTVNDDLSGRTCRHTCLFATGEGCAEGERCKALKKTPTGEPNSVWGGCVPN